MTYWVNIYLDPTQNVQDFGGDRHQRPNSASEFSPFRIGRKSLLTGLLKKLRTDLAEIFGAG